MTDGKGLGKADERTSMKWVANVTGYAGVLAKLNAQYSAPEDAPAAAETTLEPRAAAAAPMYSQQQDTYRKRLKHKDARSYSHADLTAILGGKRQPVAPVKVRPHSHAVSRAACLTRASGGAGARARARVWRHVRHG